MIPPSFPLTFLMIKGKNEKDFFEAETWWRSQMIFMEILEPESSKRERQISRF